MLHRRNLAPSHRWVQIMETYLNQICPTNVLRPQHLQARQNGLSTTAPHEGGPILCGPENQITDDTWCNPKPFKINSNRVPPLRFTAALSIAGSALGRPSANSTLPVIGTLPDHFAESVTLARNSQHSDHQASESHFRATWMLQLAAGVAFCNTYNRNPPVGELRKGLFFRGRRRGAGIDSMSESFQTAFQTIYDLTGNLATNHCCMASIQTSDNPSHAPSVQC